MAVTGAYVEAMCKEVYEPKVENNKYQHSQFLSDLNKERAAFGREIVYATQTGDGGNYGAEYDLLSNDYTAGKRNEVWKMGLGRVHGLFRQSMVDMARTDSEEKALQDDLSNSMSACFSGISRTVTTFIEGGKYGVLGQVKSDLNLSTLGITGVEIPVDSSFLVKTNIGTRICFASAGSANSAYPWSNLMASGKYATIVRKGADRITVNFDAAFTGLTVYAGDYIELYTARVGNELNGPEGILDIMAAYIDRSDPAFYVGDGSGYIEKLFRGVDRSESVEELAGFYVKADGTAAKPNSEALVEALMLSKRGGRMADRIHCYINDASYFNMMKTELTNQAWQSANVTAAERLNQTVGTNKIGIAFEESFAGKLTTDASILNGTARMVDMDDMVWKDVGYLGKITDPVGNGSEGSYNIESVGRQGFGDKIEAGFDTPKLFEVSQNGKNGDGNLWEICAKVYGNLQSQQTIKNVYVKLTA